MTQANNPLHGIKLEALLTDLVDHYGWEELGRRIDIRCFNHDPSIKSSLKFLRKTQWAREKVERLYLKMIGEPIPQHLRGDAGRNTEAPRASGTQDSGRSRPTSHQPTREQPTKDKAEDESSTGVNQHIWGKGQD
ncbi:VF530 family protein [Shewanella sp. Isolate7]|uniref:VF530 family protein n=1 Tax=Shewanella sp. Isolate7 TaxID=2908528 RepID=UPI001EFEDDC3|nr:VF530 family protein [Shewanella sp. Isolate7]MCG9720694.1 VF530 family protein [Shewanella sp. Isolate7]